MGWDYIYDKTCNCLAILTKTRFFFSRFETKWVQKYNHLSICAHKHEPKIGFVMQTLEIGLLAVKKLFGNFSQKWNSGIVSTEENALKEAKNVCYSNNQKSFAVGSA